MTCVIVIKEKFRLLSYAPFSGIVLLLFLVCVNWFRLANFRHEGVPAKSCWFSMGAEE